MNILNVATIFLQERKSSIMFSIALRFKLFRFFYRNVIENIVIIIVRSDLINHSPLENYRTGDHPGGILNFDNNKKLKFGLGDER